MAKFRINYHTGAGDDVIDGTLAEAQAYADRHARYTQEAITIEDENGNEICRRNWNGCALGIEDCAAAVQFGDFGFYDDWEAAD